MKLEVTNDGSEKLALLELGEDEVGVFYFNNTLRPGASLELWHDHRHNGSGVNNLRLDAFGRELDLEFCSSRPLTDAEFEAISAAMEAF